MKLITSKVIESYVKSNKKEAQNEIPYIIKQLIENTVKNLTKLDIPYGDNTIQTGPDGIVQFNGTNKYLGENSAIIEIGTDENYVVKANNDIKKRTPNKKQNFVFVTPYCWNMRRPSKYEWIEKQKEKYNWKDIMVIDGEVLETWLEEDILTTKYFLNKIDKLITPTSISMIKDKEDELKQKTKVGLGLDFFDYNEKNYENILSDLKKEYYHIVSPTREEGMHVTLFYLRKLNKENNTIIIDDEDTWNSLVKKGNINNAILIPNFYQKNDLIIPSNNTTIIIHDKEEKITGFDFELQQRTIRNLENSLGIYYKQDDCSIDYDKIHSIVNKTLGKYMALKREIFKAPIKPQWYNESNKLRYLQLFLINKFTTRDFEIFKEFNVEKKELTELLKQQINKKDPYIIYYKYDDEYIVVNTYNVIEWLGEELDEEIIDAYCKIVEKVLFYIEPRYHMENINEKYYVEKPYNRRYSKSLKEGILRSLVITKLYLKKENNYTLYTKLDYIVKRYYESINTESEYFNFANIASELVEFDYEMFLDKIEQSIENENFLRMFNLERKDLLFSTNEYCHILWGLEKAISQKQHISRSVEILFKLCIIKEEKYGNMVNKPIQSLTEVFLGWDNLTCLTKEEKINLLEKMIQKYPETGRKLLEKILPNTSQTWSPMMKPEFDKYDEPISIKYIKEQMEYFSEYYLLYVKYYVKKLDDLVSIYEEGYFIELPCFDVIKKKTYDLMEVCKLDEERVKLKECIREKINGHITFHNEAWTLSEKEYSYFIEILEKLTYSNKIWDYIYLYNNYLLSREKDLFKEKNIAMQLVRENSENEKILLDNCLNPHDVIEDLYERAYSKKYSVDLLLRLIEWDECNPEKGYTATTYIKYVAANEGIDKIINIYNRLKNYELDKTRILFVLTTPGYNDKLYSLIENDDKLKSVYWRMISDYSEEKKDLVFENALYYKNFSLCLRIMHEENDKYDEKCNLLEKIVEEKYIPNGIDRHYLVKIFKYFENYDKIKDFERLAKLEIYFNPLLTNKSFFLSKEATKTPSLVADLVEIIYKDAKGNSKDCNENVVSTCWKILHNLKIDFNNKNYQKWCDDFLKITKSLDREKIGFAVLGQLLARCGKDKDDDIFPIKNVRNIIEKYQNKTLSESFKIEKYNMRGAHFVGIGEEEYALYEMYKNWSEEIMMEFPETSKILKELAESYKQESDMNREQANYV